jgi:acetyl-CoA C-acetyltransferase
MEIRAMSSQNKKEVVVVSAVRTPFCKFGGPLREIHSTDLGTLVIKECLRRASLKGEDLDELYYGMCDQAEAALYDNINGRQALLRAGLPDDLVSLTIDRACCSSLTAVDLCRRTILLEEGEICMAVGAENMSNTPLLINGHRWGVGLKPPVVQDYLNPLTYREFNPIAKDAGEVAAEHGINRQMQDEWALGSQRKWQAANQAGKFLDELVPVEVPQTKGDPILFDTDDFPKPNSTIEGLSRLKTIYGSPSVTAGNAPGLDAGASAILLMEKGECEKRKVSPLATIISIASAAGEPRKMAELPAITIKRLLKKTGLELDSVDLIEINEAFAAVVLTSTKLLAEGSESRWDEIKEKTNVNGGAIAIGHPVGASGARVLMTLIYELRRRGGGIGICAICGGLAQSDAALVKVPTVNVREQ